MVNRTPKRRKPKTLYIKQIDLVPYKEYTENEMDVIKTIYIHRRRHWPEVYASKPEGDPMNIWEAPIHRSEIISDIDPESLVNHLFILYKGSKVVASCATIHCGHLCELVAVSTDPAHFRKGYASNLIRRVLHAYTNSGFRSIWIYTDASKPYLQGLYERFGFRRLHRTEPHYVSNAYMSERTEGAESKFEQTDVQMILHLPSAI
jgi:ribosomal protein S18 acetylase RimI-like enzyme